MASQGWQSGATSFSVQVVGRVERDGRVFEVGAAPVQARGWLLVFRDGAKPDEPFFLAQRASGGSQEPRVKPWIVDEAHTLALWRASLEISLQHGAWGRILWFDSTRAPCEDVSQAAWRLFVLPDGRGSWTNLRSSPKAFAQMAPFVCGSEAPEVIASSSFWQRRVEEALSQDTDVSFALSCLQHSEDELLDLLVCWRKGSRALFLHLCRCIGQLLVNRDGAWKGSGLIVYVNLQHEGQGEFFVHDGGFGAAFDLPDTSEAERCWSLLKRDFAPHPNEALAGRHTCAASWANEGAFYLEFGFDFAPSHHERLEARQSVLDWARGAGIESEFLALLENA